MTDESMRSDAHKENKGLPIDRWQVAHIRSPEELIADYSLPRPHLITEILSRRLVMADGGHLSEDDIWQWSVAERLRALASIVSDSGASEFSAIAACLAADCDQLIQLNLDLAAIRQPSDVDGIYCFVSSGERLQLRLPTGTDQRTLLKLRDADDLGLVREMATRLVVSVDGGSLAPDTPCPPEWISTIETALAANDPAYYTEEIVTCPECGHDNPVEIDLEELLIDRLMQQQEQLFQQIDLLATAYRWSESAIVGLPEWRRERYVGLVSRR